MICQLSGLARRSSTESITDASLFQSFVNGSRSTVGSPDDACRTLVSPDDACTALDPPDDTCTTFDSPSEPFPGTGSVALDLIGAESGSDRLLLKDIRSPVPSL